MMLEVIYNGVPPTSNHAYSTNIIRRMTKTGIKHVPIRFLNKTSKDFKTDFYSSSINVYDGGNKPTIKQFTESCKNKEMILCIEFWLFKKRLYCLNGKIKKFDTSNRIKLIEDSLSKLIGLDDSQNFRITVEKKIIQDDLKEYTSISLYPKR